MKKLISILSAFLLCAVAYGANVYTNSFVRDGVTYVQRGVLTAKDYVVTNVVGGGGGGAVNSVNGKTGDVVLNAGDVGAIPEGTTVPLAQRADSAAYADEAGMVNWPNILQKPAWLDRDGKPTYTAAEVGALPVDGIAQEAEFANRAGSVYWVDVSATPWWIQDDYAAVANEANYANEAGSVSWGGVTEKPLWIGDEKPIYTATEVGAAPAKTTIILGGASPNYELRLNGVAQTFDQVSNYVSHGEVIAKHLNGFYKPTYLSASEIMFDCTGFIAGDVSTRRIHMMKSNNKVVLDDTKVLAEETWVLGLSTTYINLAGSAFVSLNQSVQTVTVNGSPVTISMPTAVHGGTRDFVVYVNNTSAETDAPLVLPAGTYYADDDAATNAFTKGTVSALYITEMSGAFMLGRKELKQIVVQ